MSWSDLPKLDPIHKPLLVGTAMLVMVTACSPESEPDTTNSVISIDEIIIPLSRYLDSVDGPPFVLWDDVGAPVFAPQSCTEYLGFGLEGNTPSVQDEGDGTFTISSADARQRSGLDETFKWHFDPTTGEVTSLQEIC